MRASAFAVVEQFEEAVARYTGAPYCVACDSCTNALFLSLLFVKGPAPYVSLPRRTYVGVAQAALNAGYGIEWRDEDWRGVYALGGTPIVDAAKRFTGGMFEALDDQHSRLVCVSFQAGKILPIGRGGAVLTDSLEARNWLRRARFDGRTPGDDGAPIQVPGWHMYLDPPSAARGLWLLSWLPKHNDDLPSDEYDDLSAMECFR